MNPVLAMIPCVAVAIYLTIRDAIEIRSLKRRLLAESGISERAMALIARIETERNAHKARADAWKSLAAKAGCIANADDLTITDTGFSFEVGTQRFSFPVATPAKTERPN